MPRTISRPTVFVGSSTPALAIAKELKHSLSAPSRTFLSGILHLTLEHGCLVESSIVHSSRILEFL